MINLVMMMESGCGCIFGYEMLVRQKIKKKETPNN